MRTMRMSDDAIAVQIGQAIRERRLRKNITQDELANSVGISTPTLQKLEKGKGTLATLISTLRALGSLDLLTPLMTPPPVSPLAVAKSKKSLTRVRAIGHARATATATNTAVIVSKGSAGTTLLIPKKKRRNQDGEDS